jgi:hypothetical protein
LAAWAWVQRTSWRKRKINRIRIERLVLF